MTPSVRFFVKLLAGLLTGWLVLIWTRNLANPGWLRPDTESLLAIPALALWAVGFWEEILQFARGKKQPEAGPPAVQVTVQNILPAPLSPVLPPETASAEPIRYDSSNRLLAGPDDPLLDPWLGKPLHGRDREIEQLAALLAAADTDVQVTHPLVLAEGGVGKTELCKAALRRYLHLHPFRKAWFVNLESASSLGSFWQRLADAIGLGDFRSEAALLTALPEGLFYLDNLESLAETPNLAAHLRKLSQKPGVRLLVSSRKEVPGWGKIFNLDTLPGAAAVALFREVWDAGGRQKIPDGDPALAGFVERELGCLPLAIVLVAALGRYEHTFEAVCRRWQAEGAAAAACLGADGRLDSLEQSIRLSLHRLPPEARLLWGLAAFFPEGLPADFLGELLRAEPGTRAGRDQLLDHRILHRQADTGRLRLGPPLARFARDASALDRDGFAAAAIFQRLAPWLQALGERADADRDGQAIARLLEEFPTMKAVAVCFAGLDPRPEGFWTLMRAWSGFYTRRTTLAREIFAAVLSGKPETPDPDLAWSLLKSGDVLFLLGENAAARSEFEKALPLYEKVGSDLGKANTLQSLGDLEKVEDRPAVARDAWQTALALYQKVAEPMGEGFCHVRLARATRVAGETAQAARHLEAARACAARAGSPYLQKEVDELAGES